MMGKLIFYVLVGLGGAVLVIDGGVHNRWPEFVVGLVLGIGVQVMLGTGWWLRWERTTEQPLVGYPRAARVWLDSRPIVHLESGPVLLSDLFGSKPFPLRVFDWDGEQRTIYYDGKWDGEGDGPIPWAPEDWE